MRQLIELGVEDVQMMRSGGSVAITVGGQTIGLTIARTRGRSDRKVDRSVGKMKKKVKCRFCAETFAGPCGRGSHEKAFHHNEWVKARKGGGA